MEQAQVPPASDSGETVAPAYAETPAVGAGAAGAAAVPPATTPETAVDTGRQKPASGRCSDCGNESLMFNDDGSGSCPDCGKQFWWDASRKPAEEVPAAAEAGTVPEETLTELEAPDADGDGIPDPIGPGDMQP